MQMTRRSSMKLALAGLAASALPKAADALSVGTEIPHVTLHPVHHASFFLEMPGMVIAVDPVGEASLYKDLPAPDLILITHEHGDHFDPERLTALAGDKAQVITNPTVHNKLPASLKARALAMKNGDSTTIGDLRIKAVPAYNTTPDRQQYHPQGRDNGYILTVDGQNIYIAGDTEPTPEMLALTGIALALLPMNLPYTMTAEQAAEAVATFKPDFVYPYHHKGTDPNAFKAMVESKGGPTKVIVLNWYPETDDPTGAQ